MEPQTQMMQEAPEDAGRGTDTVMAHMSLGEVVIPRAFLDDPDVMQMLEILFQQNGASLAEFTVGDPSNKINPETGYPEFFFKRIGKIFKKAANIVLPNLGAVGGFANGLIQGQGLGGALKQGLGSGLQAGASIIGGPIAGAAAGGLNAGLNGRDPLTGAVTGGIGGAFGGSTGLGALGDTQVGRALSDTVIGRAVGSIGDSLGDVIGFSPKPLQGPTLSGAPLSGTAGKGLLGSIGGLQTGSTGGGSTFNALGAAANIFGGLNQEAALKKQQKQLLGANQQQLANLESFDPSGITSEPGYQFQLAEGQKALDRQLAAAGATGSGRAIKAGAEYGQNYANSAFKDYYARWLQKTQGKNQLIGAGGDIRANATGAGAQNIAQSLSNAIGSPVGQFGQGMTLEQLRKLGLA